MNDGAAVEMATTRVLEVEGEDVVLAAGALAGVALASDVTLLRDGEPIIHPLSGKVLGTPQEPVAVVRVYEVGEETSRAKLVKMYSAPMPDDMAEFEKMPAMPVDELTAGKFEDRVSQLEASIEEYGETSQKLKKYPAFARRVWDEVSTMKSYLVALDERLVELEEQQSEDHYRLTSVLSGEYRRQDLEEFTIRYTPDTQLKLKAAGKTLLISVVRDSLHMEEMADAPGAMPSMEEDEGISFWERLMGGGEDEEVEEEEEMMRMELPDETADAAASDAAAEEPWYTRQWQMIGAVGLVIAFILMAWLVLRKRVSDATEGLEEFEDEYLGDDEDEDDDDEEY